MTSGEIIEWIYDLVEDEEFGSIDEVKELIKDADTKGYARNFLGNPIAQSAIKGSKIQTKITEFNNNTESKKTIDKLIKEIVKAEEVEDIEKIELEEGEQLSRAALVERVGEEKAREYIDAKTEIRSNLESLSEQGVREIKESIDSGDIPSDKEIEELTRTLPDEIAMKQLANEARNK